MQGGENQVARQGCLDGDLRCCHVSHFPYQNTVRVLPQEGAENHWEIQADGFIDRNLDDAVNIVFNRVFCRQHLGINGIDFTQGGIQRSCLAGAGGAGNDENAVGLVDRIQNIFVDMRGKPQVVHVQVDGRAVQNAEHHGFSVLSGKGGNAHVHGTVSYLLDDAAVLRNAAFRNVHVCHDLDAGNDRYGQVDGGRLHFIQGAVHTVADFEFLLKRFEVNVGGLFLDGLCNDEVHKADDGSGGGILRLIVDLHVVQFLHQVGHGGGFASIKLIDAFGNLVIRRYQNMDVLAEGEAQVFHRLRIQGIHQADVQAFRTVPHRERPVQAHERGRHHVLHVRIRLEVVQCNEFRTQVAGNHLPDIILAADDAEVCKHFRQFLAGGDHFLLDVLCQGFVNHSPADEKFQCEVGVHNKQNE